MSEYPSDADLDRIIGWPPDDPKGWLDFCEDQWNTNYGDVRHLASVPLGPVEHHFITGGWSGNESIIHAMRQNDLLWGMLWQSSHRGGLHVLREP